MKIWIINTIEENTAQSEMVFTEADADARFDAHYRALWCEVMEDEPFPVDADTAHGILCGEDVRDDQLMWITQHDISDHPIFKVAQAAAEPAPDLDEPISNPKHGGFDPDDMSEKRIGWGGNAVAGIMRDTGTDIEDALSDLLADLMHWSHANGQDFAEELRRAVGQFSAETSEGGGW